MTATMTRPGHGQSGSQRGLSGSGQFQGVLLAQSPCGTLSEPGRVTSLPTTTARIPKLRGLAHTPSARPDDGYVSRRDANTSRYSCGAACPLFK